jgi:hypothetical protein
VEHETVFADGRAFAFHIACANIWHALKGASADREWRVTCSCKERVGFADTFAAAEALGRARGFFRSAANGVEQAARAEEAGSSDG